MLRCRRPSALHLQHATPRTFLKRRLYDGCAGRRCGRSTICWRGRRPTAASTAGAALHAQVTGACTAMHRMFLRFIMLPWLLCHVKDAAWRCSYVEVCCSARRCRAVAFPGFQCFPITIPITYVAKGADGARLKMLLLQSARRAWSSRRGQSCLQWRLQSCACRATWRTTLRCGT